MANMVQCANLAAWGQATLYDWYTRTVEAVRSPQQGLLKSFEMSQHWMSDQQLKEFLERINRKLLKEAIGGAKK